MNNSGRLKRGRDCLSGVDLAFDNDAVHGTSNLGIPKVCYGVLQRRLRLGYRSLGKIDLGGGRECAKVVLIHFSVGEIVFIDRHQLASPHFVVLGLLEQGLHPL